MRFPPRRSNKPAESRMKSSPPNCLDAATSNNFRVMEGDPAMKERYANLVESFEVMREVADALNIKRITRGFIDFDMSETNIVLDKSGKMIVVTRAERNNTHRLIEEFMLGA